MNQKNKRGFTLIELLVVVLIIGILAAVALPQYQLAVDKTQLSSMIPYAKALAQAQEVYYLSNGVYAHDTEGYAALDVEIPSDALESRKIGNFTFDLSDKWAGFYYTIEGKRVSSYVIYFRHLPPSFSTHEGKTMCFSYAGHEQRGNRLCQALGGTKIAYYNTCANDSICGYYQLIP